MKYMLPNIVNIVYEFEVIFNFKFNLFINLTYYSYYSYFNGRASK